VQDWDSYQADWQLDPLNPRVFIQDFNRSYVEMPAHAIQMRCGKV